MPLRNLANSSPVAHEGDWIGCHVCDNTGRSIQLSGQVTADAHAVCLDSTVKFDSCDGAVINKCRLPQQSIRRYEHKSIPDNIAIEMLGECDISPDTSNRILHQLRKIPSNEHGAANDHKTFAFQLVQFASAGATDKLNVLVDCPFSNSR